MQIKSSKKILLLELLAQLAPDSSKNTLRSWIESGRVSIGEKLASRANEIVQEGQEVNISAKPKFIKGGLKILYEDDDLVVVLKPAGLLSVGTDLESHNTVHGLLKHRFHRPTVYPVHRLDKETSGLLVFAYTERARNSLKDQLEKRTMHREYIATVHGHPGEGTWRCFLKENANFQVSVCPPSQGKEAITHFETIKKRGKYSVLKLRLETGRKHQIRVQATHAGFPLFGDQKYGLPEDQGKQLKLKAVALYFIHPRTRKEMKFTQKGV